MEADGHLHPVFFATPGEFRAWLAENHEREDVLWVGFWKKGTGIPSITWPESVEMALCFGWIDGLRRSLDAERYAIRFTPRRPGSRWSDRNLAVFAKLEAAGRVESAGRAAHEARKGGKMGRSHEEMGLDPALRERFMNQERAWSFFQSQPPGYRRIAIRWVMSAKRESTRESRLAVLVEDSAAGLRIKEMRR